jgi:hypothetical protein
MPFKIVGYLTRKPGMTPAEFRDYYENIHMPLLVSLTGPVFPKTHTRTYLTRTPINPSSSDNTNANYVAAAFAGKPEDFEYDAYAELVFENAEKFAEFGKRLAEIREAEDGVFHKDELAFLDVSKAMGVVVEEPVVTVGNVLKDAEV